MLLGALANVLSSFRTPCEGKRFLTRHGAGLVCLVGLAAGCVGPSGRLPSDVRAVVDSIEIEEIEGHMSFLADDSLEGRETGSVGFQKAADYVAERYEALDLRPAGGDGGYFQQVEFRRTILVEDDCYLEVRRGGEVERLVAYEDYYLGPDPIREDASVSAPVVFVGFGVSAPELEHDDYAGIDVRGKIVVMFRGAPEHFSHNERAFHSSGREKYRAARDRGAVGVLSMRTPEMEERYPFERAIRNARLPRMRWIDDAGAPRDTYPEIRLSGTLSPSGRDRLLSGGPVSIEEFLEAAERGSPLVFDAEVTVTARTKSEHATVWSPNVAGILPGREGPRGDEIVVLTAHLDHLGYSTPVEGDSLNNGAFDNASGIAMLLTIAKAFRELPQAPQRSILFLAVTGEEKGLLGSDRFADRPTVPIESIVANVNLDMVVMLHPLNDVVAFGAEHSSLLDPLTRAAQALGIGVAPDPVPEEVIFVRSDQYSFVRRGVPALYVVPGRDSGDPEVDGGELNLTWRKERYHTPQDDLDQPIDWGAGRDFARLNFLLAHFVANDHERPAWNPGDFFGERFGRH